MNEKRFWKIDGYESGTKFFSTSVPYGSIPKIEPLLMCLAAKAGLTFEEIVGAFGKKGTKIHNRLLEPVRLDGKEQFSCGENPYFTARVVRGEGT